MQIITTYPTLLTLLRASVSFQIENINIIILLRQHLEQTHRQLNRRRLLLALVDRPRAQHVPHKITQLVLTGVLAILARKKLSPNRTKLAIGWLVAKRIPNKKKTWKLYMLYCCNHKSFPTWREKVKNILLVVKPWILLISSFRLFSWFVFRLLWWWDLVHMCCRVERQLWGRILLNRKVNKRSASYRGATRFWERNKVEYLQGEDQRAKEACSSGKREGTKNISRSQSVIDNKDEDEVKCWDRIRKSNYNFNHPPLYKNIMPKCWKRKPTGYVCDAVSSHNSHRSWTASRDGQEGNQHKPAHQESKQPEEQKPKAEAENWQ